MRRVRNQNRLPRIPRTLEIRADHQKAGEFALRASNRLESGRFHACNREQTLLQIVKNPEAALRDFSRLLRMFARESVEPRNELIHAWIVFHRAGAEWIHAEINRVVPGREPREVANHFDLADFGESFD